MKNLETHDVLLAAAAIVGLICLVGALLCAPSAGGTW